MVSHSACALCSGSTVICIKLKFKVSLFTHLLMSCVSGCVEMGWAHTTEHMIVAFYDAARRKVTVS